MWFRWCLCADTNVLGGEENFTPLHFCARYLPRVAEHNLSETEEQTRKVDKWSSSWKAISYLTSLTGDNKVNVRMKTEVVVGNKVRYEVIGNSSFTVGMLIAVVYGIFQLTYLGECKKSVWCVPSPFGLQKRQSQGCQNSSP